MNDKRSYITIIDDPDVQHSLFKSTTEQSLDEVVSLCCATEMEKIYICEIRHDNSNYESVDANVNYTHRFNNTKKNTIKKKYDSDQSYECRKCGSHHKPRSCSTFKKVCNLCHKQIILRQVVI